MNPWSVVEIYEDNEQVVYPKGELEDAQKFAHQITRTHPKQVKEIDINGHTNYIYSGNDPITVVVNDEQLVSLRK